MEAISKLNPEEVVNSFIAERINDKGEVSNSAADEKTGLKDVNKYIVKMFPEKIANKIISQTETKPTTGTAEGTNKANDNTDANRTDILVNYILYAREDGSAPTPEDKNLSGDMLHEIYDNLTGTQSGISKVFASYNEKVKKANSIIQQKLTETERNAIKAANEKSANALGNAETGDVKADNNVAEKAKVDERNSQTMIAFAREMSRAEKIVSQGLTNAIIGCPKNNKDYSAYKNSFWGKNYQVLADVVREYKTRDKNASTTTNTTTETTNNA